MNSTRVFLLRTYLVLHICYSYGVCYFFGEILINYNLIQIWT